MVKSKTSNQDTKVESKKESTFDYQLGNLICGEDKRISLRRVLSILFTIVGIILLFIAQFSHEKEWLMRFMPCIIAILSSSLLLGIVTLQNIGQLIRGNLPEIKIETKL